MRNLYSSFAAPALGKQLRRTIGQASMYLAKTLLVTMVMITAASVKLFAQAPVISYSTPQTYTINSTITPLTPVSSGGTVAAPAYSSTQTSVGQGYSGQTSIAVDGAGNVYEVLSSHNAIKKYPGGGSTGTLIGTGLSDPYSAAIDAAGNVFVADAGDNAVKKIPAGGGATVTIVSGSFSPTGIAVDGAGNIYFADNTHGNIDEIPAGSTTPVTLGTGFNSAGGIAVDGAGNVYAADPVNRVVKMIPVGGGSPVVIGSGFNQPYSVAVDGSGNVFVTDLSNNSVDMIPAGGGTPVDLAFITSPSGIAIGSTGIIYVSNQAGAPPKEIMPVGGYFISSFLPAGLSFNNTTGVISGTPTAASPATNYTVTAYNSSGSGQATVNIKVLTNNTNLTHLVLSSGTLTPTFATGTKSYTASVGNTVASITVTPTTADGAATIKVNGTTVASGSASPAIPLSFGANTITVAVTDGAVTDTYTVTVTRPGMTVATLANLTISSGTLTPAFATGTSNYTALVTNATTSITVTPTTTNATATVKVNGTTVASGSASAALPLVVGDNSITTVVTAQDGVTTDTYNITVTRPPSGISLSYSSPQTYTAGTAVTLSPTSSGVAAYGYSASATTIASGFNMPMGIATDVAGDIYVADYGDKLVKRIPAGGGTPTTVGSGFTGPTGVAVDPAGNIWVTDSGDLKEVPAAGGAIVTTPIGDAVAVAVDSKGNVFVLASTYQSGSITEYPAGGGAGVVVSNDNNDMDTGLAIDGLGNIFVSFKVPIPDIPQVEEVNGNGNEYNNLGSGLNSPTGVAVDGIGNVFVADAGFTGIVEYPVNGAPQLTVSSGLNSPNGVALDGAGNIYESDYGTNTVKEIKAVGGYFISPGLPAGLIFDENTGIIRGTPTVASPATNYTITAHNSSGSTFATLNIKVSPPPSPPTLSYSSPQTYTVGRAITPLTPTSSRVAAPAYGNPVTLVYGVYYAADVAVDAAGNMYAGPTNSPEILKFPAGGGNGVIVAQGFMGPLSVAVDAAGNIYVADSPGTGGNGNVYKVPAGGGTKVTIGSGFVTPDGVTVDAAGNVYVADEGNNTVKKIPVGGGAPVTIGSGFNHPVGIAVDAAGNVYVADAGNNAVKKILATNGSTITLGSGFSGPKGVAVDAAGNVFVGDTGNAQVKEIPVAGGAPIIIGSGFTDPQGITTNGSGDVYAADFTSGKIIEIKLTGGYIASALPQGLSIDRSTGIISGTPTVVSPPTNYTVTGYNFGGGTPATVNIQVVANPATLANLVLSSGTLTPTFATGITSYTAAIPAATASITETPTSSDPSSTITVNGTTVTSGTASASIPLSLGANTITTVVTAAGGTGTTTYTVTAGRGSSDALLTSIHLTPTSPLAVVSGPSYVNYTTSVPYSTTSVTVTSSVQDATATIAVNGTTVASGVASPSIPLNVGSNVINIVVTAQNGVTTKTYTITATRALSNDALLTSIKLAPAASLTIVSGSSYVNYTTTYANSVSSCTVTATEQDANATLTVNGTPVASGAASPSIPLTVGSGNVINIVSTAQDGTTTKTYTITVTRAPSSDALLTSIKLAPAANLTIVSGPSYVNYTTTYHNTVSSCTVTATEQDATATLTINGTTVASGTASGPIALSVGSGNVINIVSTAQDGTTTKTYTITVTRNAPGSMTDLSQTVSVTAPVNIVPIENDGIVVHEGVSPNGDGINDYLAIDGIANYPDNRLLIVDRNGLMIYQSKGYDNSSKPFDGHSNINGKMQLPGTYFYSLDYTVNGENKHKTGYIILKY